MPFYEYNKSHILVPPDKNHNNQFIAKITIDQDILQNKYKKSNSP